MSTTPRHPPAKPIKVGSWQRDFAGLEQRRLEAARMFASGASQAEVARTFGVSAQAASVWYRRWRQGGAPALSAAGRKGRRPRLSPATLDAVDQALRKGPQAAVGPVACTTMTGPTVRRQIPHMTPAGQPTSGSDPPPNPSPSSPNEPGGIFTANLKDTELANLTRDSLEEVIDAARQGTGQVRQDRTLLFSFLRYCGLKL